MQYWCRLAYTLDTKNYDFYKNTRRHTTTARLHTTTVTTIIINNVRKQLKHRN